MSQIAVNWPSPGVLRVLVVALLLSVVLAGCSRGSDDVADPTATGETSPATAVAAACPATPGSNGSYHGTAFQAALACAISAFPWPPDKRPEAASIVARFPDPDNSNFESGLEWTMIGGQNECAWVVNWFNAHRDNDAAMEAEALRVLTDVIPDYSVSVPGFPADHVDPQQVERLRTLARQASLGDTPSVQQYMDAACQGLIQAGAV